MHKRRCFHLSYSWNLQWGRWRFAKLLELFDLQNFLANIGEEQKKVFQHFKLKISSNFGLLCVVISSWTLSIGFSNSRWEGLIPNPPVATATRLNVKNINRSFTDDHLKQHMRLATTSLEADIDFLVQQKQKLSGSLN